MSEWDEGGVYYSNQNLQSEDGNDGAGGIQPHDAKNRFREFLRNFRHVRSQVFVYRQQLLQNFTKRLYYVEVELEHLNNYDEVLLDLLLQEPRVYMEFFQRAAKEVVIQSMPEHADKTQVPEIQVLLKSRQTPTPLRKITAIEVNRLLLVPGIIINASRTSPRATSMVLLCKGCQNRVTITVEGPHAALKTPRECSECRGQGTFLMLPDESKYVDQQSLKLQESPEVVPTGEMPRSVKLACHRYLVDRVSPGTRVAVMGISSVWQKGAKGKQSKGSGPAGVKEPFLHVVGIQIMSEGSGRASLTFTPEEEQRFHDLAKAPDIYEKITRSIAPAISGDYTVDIKKAIACLLFGGSRRILPDGMKLRGDINVLMLGDPSTAKSQFLKFVEKVAPVGVYTSGKGSSAAGLTASVIRDSRGEFYLEGGAMVLADGGVVCIDEFDKMREQDRVAIHEAMEQQTISVAKAGITTVLNSRSSVLAAANPVFGTYDDMKSAAENIDFLPTILSRFDMIFIVRDVRDEAKDRAIARHILDIHINYSLADANTIEGEIGLIEMKKYISYCRAKCAPVLSEEAAEVLRNHYVGIRETHRARARGNHRSGGTGSTVPITVRQLEAIIRISEALARMQLAYQASPEHVAEAIRLFKVSTLNAAATGALPGDMSSLGQDQIKEVQAVEEQLKRRIAIGSTIPQKKIMDEFVALQGYSVFAVKKALQVLLSRGEIRHASQQKLVQRVC